MRYEKIINNEIRENIINDYVNNFLSIRDIKQKYNIKSKNFIVKVIGKNMRNSSEATKFARIKHPFKHSEDSKNKLREAAIKVLKEKNYKTPWQRRHEQSYPEKCFEEILKYNGYDTKYLIIKEFSVYPYFIDFAFVDIKVAVEVDGSQHLLPERKQKDDKKDEVLKNNGWRVIRVTAHDVMFDKVKVSEIISEFISNDSNKYEKVGILKLPVKEYRKRVRVVHSNKPSKEKLYELVKDNSFESVGRMFNVTGNCVKKWCKSYNIPSKRSELKKI